MRLKTAFSILLTLPLLLFFAQQSVAQNSDDFVVVLDAGHGGKDPGKPSKEGYKEKDIALKIVLAVGKQLEKLPNVKVVYTREKDVFVDLHVRGRIANKAKADLFVSVHCNAHTSQAYGAETYVLGLHRNKTNFEVAKAENSVVFLEENFEETYAQYDLKSPESAIGLELMQEVYLDQSILLAQFIQNNFREKLKRKDRSVKQAGFIVLHQTVMPSVLVETGFITNKGEGAYLNSKKGQEELSTAIAGAIGNYKNMILAGSIQELPDIVNTISDKTIPKEVTSLKEDKIFPDTTFKVQIAAGRKKLATKSYNFKGLNGVSRIKENNLYKYYYGATSNYTEIERRLALAKSKGYKTAYIVSFNKSNIKVPLKTVLN